MAADLGFPVVLKVRSAEIHHKSGIGGVRLGIADRAARLVGLEVLAELDPDYDHALDDERLAPPRKMASPTLYATMPTRESFERLPGLWRAYQRGERPGEGYAPWTRLFEMLDDMRAWGPEDRFSAEARVALEERLAEDEAAELRLELEVWPTRSQARRARWRGEAERRVAALGGQVPSRSSIEEEGFIYEALLVALSAGSVRELIANPEAVEGLAISRSISAKPRFGHTHWAPVTTGSCAAPEHAGMVPLLTSRRDGCWRIHNRIGDASRGVSLTMSATVSSLTSIQAS